MSESIMITLGEDVTQKSGKHDQMLSKTSKTYIKLQVKYTHEITQIMICQYLYSFKCATDLSGKI